MAKENFLLVSLKEDEAKKLAQVISNETSRRILDFLATRKDATESSAAKDLKIPISTVHYNLKALMKAKLVQVDEFHYSDKGKEVNHYSLANKYVIIAPKNPPETLREKLKKILPVGLIAIASATILQLYYVLRPLTAADSVRLAPLLEKQMLQAPKQIWGFTNPIWFLFGVIFTIIVLIAVDYIKSRNHH